MNPQEFATAIREQLTKLGTLTPPQLDFAAQLVIANFAGVMTNPSMPENEQEIVAEQLLEALHQYGIKTNELEEACVGVAILGIEFPINTYDLSSKLRCGSNRLINTGDYKKATLITASKKYAETVEKKAPYLAPFLPYHGAMLNSIKAHARLLNAYLNLGPDITPGTIQKTGNEDITHGAVASVAYAQGTGMATRPSTLIQAAALIDTDWDHPLAKRAFEAGLVNGFSQNCLKNHIPYIESLIAPGQHFDNQEENLATKSQNLTKLSKSVNSIVAELAPMQRGEFSALQAQIKKERYAIMGQAYEKIDLARSVIDRLRAEH